LVPLTHTTLTPISVWWSGHFREMTVPTLVPLPWTMLWVPRDGRGMGVHWPWEMATKIKDTGLGFRFRWG